MVPDVTEKEVRQVYDDGQSARILSGQAKWTALVVPIKASGEVIGVMSLVSNNWGGNPPANVWHAAEGLAGRAGVALVNARRFHLERSTATLLADSLLPLRLPRVPGYEAAARYIPAEGRVAGDWFDVVRLPSGRFLVGVGDVGGHGIRAASSMTQLRNAARGLAIAGGGPGKLMDGLAQLSLTDDTYGFATALYGLLEPNEGTFVWSSAGHIPPLSFGASSVSWLSLAGYPAFGLPITGPADERQHHFAPGDGIVLLTDGVVERRGTDLGDGLERLAKLVAEHSDRDVQPLADAIVAEFCANPDDDCCIVVLRRAQGPN